MIIFKCGVYERKKKKKKKKKLATRVKINGKKCAGTVTGKFQKKRPLR